MCDCHGEPKYWSADRSREAGGQWRCVVRRRESWRRYHRTPESRAVIEARYRQSEKGRETKADNNARRMFVGRVYVGTCGFTQAEREEMIRGATKRP